MASQLDLQEQEQLDQLKAFWNRHGNLLTWLVTLALLALAAFNGWNWWQREQAAKAAALHAELERAVLAGETERVSAAWSDLKARYPNTAYAPRGALLAAKMLAERQQPDAALAAVQWVADAAPEIEYRAVARLRWAGLLLDQAKAQEALDVLDKARGAGFDALVDDRRGDAWMALQKPDQAREAYQAAWKGLSAELDYRRIVEAKLLALGVDTSTLEPAGARKEAT